jgi:hypothetical protein
MVDVMISINKNNKMQFIPLLKYNITILVYLTSISTNGSVIPFPRLSTASTLNT